MDPIKGYLADGTLPAHTKEAERVKKRADWFILYKGILYKCSYVRPLLRCVMLKMGMRILKEIHEGVYSSHIGRRVLIVVAVHTRYY